MAGNSGGGGQNALYKFCGGYGPPAPPGSDAYGLNINFCSFILYNLYDMQ